MSTTSVVLLLFAVTFAINLVLYLRTPEDWDPPYMSRQSRIVVARLLALGIFGAFLLSLVAPSLFANSLFPN